VLVPFVVRLRDYPANRLMTWTLFKQRLGVSGGNGGRAGFFLVSVVAWIGVIGLGVHHRRPANGGASVLAIVIEPAIL